MMVKMESVSIADGHTEGISWELNWDFGSFPVFIHPFFPLILGWVLPV